MELPALLSFTSEIKALDYLNYWYIELKPEHLIQLPGHAKNSNFNQRLLIQLDDAVSWQCGVLALGEGSGLITVQKARLKQLGKTLGDEVSVSLWEDTSEFGVEIPEELLIYWEQVPQAKDRFYGLKPSMQRYILKYIQGVKSLEKRSDRCVMLMENLLHCTEGKETFRILLGKE